MGLQTDLLIQLTSILTQAPGGGLDLETRTAILTLAEKLSIADGAGANQASKKWSDHRQLAGNDDIDLNAVLLDAFGVAIPFTRVGLLYVKATPANTANILVGPAAANGFVTPWNAAADRDVIRPGGYLLKTAFDATGFVVTAGTGDILRVAPASGTQDYDIVVIGS